MEHIDLRKLNRGELKQVRRQGVRLKKMGKTGKEIEELVRQLRCPFGAPRFPVFDHGNPAPGASVKPLLL